MFLNSNGISILLIDGDPMPTEKESLKCHCFQRGAIQCRDPLSSSFTLQTVFHFMKISLAFLHPNTIRVLMGCSILDMLFCLDLFLLEVLFIYTVKMSRKGIFNVSVHIQSFQLVMGLLDSTKGTTKGHVVVSGP